MPIKPDDASPRMATCLAAVSLLATCLPASAHGDHASLLALGSLASGLLHPFTGLLHMLVLPALGFAAMRLLARPVVRAGLALAAVLASWLGHASNLPMDVAVLPYLAGFVASSLLVIASGMLLGAGQRLQPVRLAGVTITLSSLYMLGA